ncbi:Probable beta-glucosidase L; AltName: Full=Beta-D-glucoside glucohydrolase L; AltName: Full=Cellobiase L; AltName: Full=Gentiobiase L; Flags: Precursor [Serendipita indica DSM 11827]|nr:Probable beta-glucosidase L; AltName: Full=Beta-D-glucoside glucohydrolase L; AltName: Full=Cellobiase L; AltName: Full=Gentiobiase L; Flags: Precursor [Serendipita indica DSM 11827]
MRFLLTATSLYYILAASASPTPLVHESKRGLDLNAVNANWAAAYSKAKAALTKYNLTEKVALTTGAGWQVEGCVGNIPAIPSQNFPGICLQDAPSGVRLATEVSSFPSGINTVATFNRDLMYQRAVAMGAEFKGKGIGVALSPMMNIFRAPAAGRAFEGSSEPYLTGVASALTVQGIQSQGVQATAKHWLNNEQEHFRDYSSSNVDDRTQHEVYAYPFIQSIVAGAASVMCSYNRVDNKYACSNPELLNGLLKSDIGFKGYVMSDWWANHATSDALAGLDMTMPGNKVYGNAPDSYFGPELIAAVQNGTVPQSRVDDMALRILADKGFPAPNIWSWDFNDPRNKHVDVQADHKKIIRQIGAASTVLLKNKKALPFKKPRSLALIGSDAAVNPAGPNACPDRGCNNGTLAQGWGSGTVEYPYLVDPLSAITARAKQDGTVVSSSLSDTDLAAAAATAKGKDAAIVFITADSGEGYITVEGNQGDRNDLFAWHGGDDLVKAVAAVNRNTIVVVHATGPILMEAWIENPNVSAVLWAGVPGQEAGNAITDVLYGATNPSGRLPFTIAKQRSDYPADILYTSTEEIPQINYTEGLLIDYRWFDAKKIAPRFEFGFGLSYTKFDYSALAVWPYASKGGPRLTTDPTLFENIATVTFILCNKGPLEGTEIPQLYLEFPKSANSPPQLLKGFEAVSLKKGETRVVKFDLTRQDLSIWNTNAQRWVIPSGSFGVSVGASSRDKRLKGTLVLW